jgi:hypothetical protein
MERGGREASSSLLWIDESSHASIGVGCPGVGGVGPGIGAGVVAISGIGAVRDFVIVMCTFIRLMISSDPGAMDLLSSKVSIMVSLSTYFECRMYSLPLDEGQSDFARLKS